MYKTTEKITLLMACLLAFTLLCKVIGYADTGFDFTDEGYYYNWFKHPWLYHYYESQFGFIYHPIFQWLGENIASLRIANMLISVGLSWLFAYQVLLLTNQTPRIQRQVVYAFLLGMPALYILMITGYWLPSPSYNSLNFQGCLIAAISFVLYERRQSPSVVGAVLAMGGWVIFMAKPSTALLLTVITILYYAVDIRHSWRILVTATLISLLLLLLSALWIDGSLIQFYQRYKGGLTLMSSLGGGHGFGSLLRFDFFPVLPAFKLKFHFYTILFLAGFWLLAKNKSFINVAFTIGLIAAVAAALHALFYQTLGASSMTSKYHTLILCSLMVSGLLFKLICKQGSVPTYRKLLVLLLVFPYVYAAGTSNNYWHTAAGAMVFWVLWLWLLIVPTLKNNLQQTFIVTVVTCFTCFGVIRAMESPYRQTESIFAQKNTINYNNTLRLVMPKESVAYVHQLQEIAKTGGFVAGTPLIDLTGHHPGSLFFLEASAIGQAWTIGGYAGSDHLASMALNQASCEEISQAWLLIEKEGRRTVTDKILLEHGITVNKENYELVGKLPSIPLSDWSAKTKTHPDGRYQQYLIKPVKSTEMVASCEAYREQHGKPIVE